MTQHLQSLRGKSKKDLWSGEDLFFENAFNNELLLWTDVVHVIRQGHHHCESCAENVKGQLYGGNVIEKKSAVQYTTLCKIVKNEKLSTKHTQQQRRPTLILAKAKRLDEVGQG